jgi:hypothetical protein
MPNQLDSRTEGVWSLLLEALKDRRGIVSGINMSFGKTHGRSSTNTATLHKLHDRCLSSNGYSSCGRAMLTTKRLAYLPNNLDGRYLLKRLEYAFMP